MDSRHRAALVSKAAAIHSAAQASHMAGMMMRIGASRIVIRVPSCYGPASTAAATIAAHDGRSIKMGEILGIGVTHFPGLMLPDAYMSSFLTRTLKSDRIPAEMKEPSS